MKNRLLLLSILFTGMASQAQEDTAFIQHRIDSLFQARQVPGIIIGVSRMKVRTYHTAGYANREKEQRWDPGTQLEVGSITKTFTAYILSSVLMEKKIDDHAPIGDFLPDSVGGNDQVSRISFRQLMSHTSGLPRLPSNMDASKNFLQPYQNYGMDALYSFLRKARPDTSRKYNYSNLGMGLAGDLACTISGKSYPQLLERYITKPFRMNSTALVVKEGAVASQGYFNDKTPAEYWDMDALGPAGAVKSNTLDMLTYAEYILDHSGNPILQDITSPIAPVNDQLQVGKAWHILKSPGKPDIIWHNGGTYGFSTFCGFVRETRTAVFVAINAFNKNAFSDGLGFEILKRLSENK
jgi:CubicO group peptidase (beta-lactamase class C family)